MDAAQMLTAQEIARQCEQLAHAVAQRENRAEPGHRRHLRLAEPITQPIERITEPIKPEPVVPGPSRPAEDEMCRERTLTDREKQILAFERQWWKRPGAKELAIRELFDMSASRYYQLLNALLDEPAAVQADPMLIKRLRKTRATRQRARNARRLGIEWH